MDRVGTKLERLGTESLFCRQKSAFPRIGYPAWPACAEKLRFSFRELPFKAAFGKRRPLLDSHGAKTDRGYPKNPAD
jgi:hypothetical protein